MENFSQHLFTGIYYPKHYRDGDSKLRITPHVLQTIHLMENNAL